MRVTLAKTIAVLTAVAIVAAACGDDSTPSAEEPAAESSAEEPAAEEPAAEEPAAEEPAAEEPAAEEPAAEEPAAEEPAAATSLAAVCPDPLVVQTSWFPEVEYGWLYEFVGDDGVRDGEAGTYSGPVGDINVEVRAGGPFVGFQPVAATIYEDPNVFFGTLELDEAMRGWATGQPLVQVMSHFIRHPIGFMYDPEKYDFETVEDIRDSGVTVLVFEGSGYMDYYLGRGLLDPDQVDASNNGAPDRWIAADGDIVQSVFVTQEPLRWEFELDAWMKPVGTMWHFDQGYQPYEGLVVRPESLDESRECLELVIPMMQQAIVDFAADPSLAAEQVALLNEEIGDFWQTSEAHNLRGAALMVEFGILSNEHNSTLGDFDFDRVAEQMAVYREVYEAQNIDVPAEVTPETLVTNEFVDPDIGL